MHAIPTSQVLPQTCRICLDSLDDQQQSVARADCVHYSHFACLEKWLIEKPIEERKCLICQADASIIFDKAGKPLEVKQQQPQLNCQNTEAQLQTLLESNRNPMQNPEQWHKYNDFNKVNENIATQQTCIITMLHGMEYPGDDEIIHLLTNPVLQENDQFNKQLFEIIAKMYAGLGIPDTASLNRLDHRSLKKECGHRDYNQLQLIAKMQHGRGIPDTKSQQRFSKILDQIRQTDKNMEATIFENIGYLYHGLGLPHDNVLEPWKNLEAMLSETTGDYNEKQSQHIKDIIYSMCKSQGVPDDNKLKQLRNIINICRKENQYLDTYCYLSGLELMMPDSEIATLEKVRNFLKHRVCHQVNKCYAISLIFQEMGIPDNKCLDTMEKEFFDLIDQMTDHENLLFKVAEMFKGMGEPNYEHFRQLLYYPEFQQDGKPGYELLVPVMEMQSGHGLPAKEDLDRLCSALKQNASIVPELLAAIARMQGKRGIPGMGDLLLLGHPVFKQKNGQFNIELFVEIARLHNDRRFPSVERVAEVINHPEFRTNDGHFNLEIFLEVTEKLPAGEGLPSFNDTL